MPNRKSDAYDMNTRQGPRRVRLWPFVTTVQGGWVGKTQSQTSKVASYRHVPVTSYDDVEHYRDHYATYGADPSLPDAIRPLDTSTVHTGRQSWTEREERTTYEMEFDGYRDVTSMWRDISWDGGGRTRSRWNGTSAGHRVYHVDVSLFGRRLHGRMYDATNLRWERPPAFGWSLLGRQALELIEVDVAAWRSRARNVSPGWSQFLDPERRLVCIDGTVAAVGEGMVTIRHGDGSRTIGEKPGLPASVGDFVMLASSPHGGDPVAVHNVSTGGTWRILAGSVGPSPKVVLREHALTIVAGLTGLTALIVGLHDRSIQHLTAPVVLAALAVGYLLGRRATLRLGALTIRVREERTRIDSAVSYMRELAWLGIRNMPASPSR